MRTGLIFCALTLAALMMPVETEEVNKFISDLRVGGPGVREGSAWALGLISDPKAVDPLIQTLNDSDDHVRSTSAVALGDIGDLRAVYPLILALNDSNSDVRMYAARALGEIGDPRATDPLIAALKDEDDGVRAVAAHSLGRIGDLKAIEPLTSLLNDTVSSHADTDQHVRMNAAWALGEISNSRTSDVLYRWSVSRNGTAWEPQISSMIHRQLPERYITKL